MIKHVIPTKIKNEKWNKNKRSKKAKRSLPKKIYLFYDWIRSKKVFVWKFVTNYHFHQTNITLGSFMVILSPCYSIIYFLRLLIRSIPWSITKPGDPKLGLLPRDPLSFVCLFVFCTEFQQLVFPHFRSLVPIDKVENR